MGRAQPDARCAGRSAGGAQAWSVRDAGQSPARCRRGQAGGRAAHGRGDHDPADGHARRTRACPLMGRRRGGRVRVGDRRDDEHQAGNDDRDAEGGGTGRGDRTRSGVLLVRHERPHTTRLRFQPGRRGAADDAGIPRPGAPAVEPVRHDRRRRCGRTRADGYGTRTCRQPGAHGRGVRRARR